jgi:hypothetical protein
VYGLLKAMLRHTHGPVAEWVTPLDTWQCLLLLLLLGRFCRHRSLVCVMLIALSPHIHHRPAAALPPAAAAFAPWCRTSLLLLLAVPAANSWRWRSRVPPHHL